MTCCAYPTINAKHETAFARLDAEMNSSRVLAVDKGRGGPMVGTQGRGEFDLEGYRR